MSKDSESSRLRDERLKKLQTLRDQGVQPYPYKFDRTHQNKDLQEK